MKDCYFSFRSVTAAQRGLRALTAAGIPAAISRTPGALAKKGCGYCLRVSEARAPEAARALRGMGVQGVWRRTPSGYEEAERDLF